MRKIIVKTLTKVFFVFVFCATPLMVLSQVTPLPKLKSDFWSRVQFGGGFGLSIGNGFTDITVAPSAIYNVNKYFSVGPGVQYSHLSQRDFFTSNVIGASVIGLFNPLEEIQASLELEQVNVSTIYKDLTIGNKNNFWYTGLHVGLGYRTDGVVIGFRYNLLFDKDIDLYGEALMPFVRVFF